MMKRFTAKDYQRQFLQLQPPGLAWNRRLDSNLGRFWLAAGHGLARVEDEAFRLIDEANPLTTWEALPDWERVLGLPDECSELGDTMEIRRADVIAKLNHPVGQSKQYYIDFMAIYGYTIEIRDEWPPFRADVSLAGDRTWEAAAGTMIDENGDVYVDYYHGWAFVWEVSWVNRYFRRFKVGADGAGDMLAQWYAEGQQCVWFRAEVSQADDYLRECHNPDLECRLNKIKPAHTHLLFNYIAVEVD
ncbi:DUF2313 domain-containing protein [Deltaproteobacteria bacterium OttesenSCG-928-M10]|nr:DUF2313 domain-containing protein [Deltaproteobacteria bacterium OttesenSCG-928-M10]